jgi:hypothetical protein
MAVATRTYDLATIERFRKGLQADYGKYNDPTYLGFVLLFNDYDVRESPHDVRVQFICRKADLMSLACSMRLTEGP